MFEAQVEADETQVGWWISINGRRLGVPFLDEDDAYHTADWLNGKIHTDSDPPALDDILGVLMREAATPAGEGAASGGQGFVGPGDLIEPNSFELPVLGTVGGGLANPPSPDQLTMQEALAAYDTLAHKLVKDDPPSRLYVQQMARAILERRRA